MDRAAASPEDDERPALEAAHWIPTVKNVRARLAPALPSALPERDSLSFDERIQHKVARPVLPIIWFDAIPPRARVS